MDIQQCISAYQSFSEKAFKQQRRIPFNAQGNVRGRYSSKELEAAVKTILKDQGYSEEELLKDPDNMCRVFGPPVLTFSDSC